MLALCFALCRRQYTSEAGLGEFVRKVTHKAGGAGWAERVGRMDEAARRGDAYLCLSLDDGACRMMGISGVP